ncbi:cyanide-forming glycine dehydrogenase subunit HcnA [Pseudomonas gingeri]|uniref:Cyanide-forming glycine dehydrogenase subunit HcnA n=1 Tax=Pseudomonas gingeri TaxID=117681 RepID=A0A7Y7YHD0_9PSED|nr:cyanide-forming glycine dehydrogenase subunit HcnA [Pseudomonas gingeri]NWA03608.1 cyanide-forming glycine dehydrogenase subunit HcnA [Pseudomonas gingeri]NWA14466.1 cyanide-forming glycine dehydrogenase subunit HcnA [Pseudomonas gingeri]NWA54916.1 cyanide-forming glycine dehydrogenase subunit HcnA [Pseudomonas gingeri]NWA94640.1 cyanide-forming glycine dehydrogenase subunit HcnA [Pseudomonas gingeri]NWB01296.1 cyanide-forming glycine dehydrogenase subunit HcnA [Pseudomonas gingeri]
MHDLDRKYDIQPLVRADMTLHLNGRSVAAAEGETVLSVLQSVGLRQVSRNDHGQLAGAFCGMGVCQSCLVSIDGRLKRRACQTLVRPGMRIETGVSRFAVLEVL